MAKDFKIVEPEFVTKAKQSAVAAVEARFRHEEEQRRKLERRARAKGCMAWLILVALALAGGGYWACVHYGIGISDVKMRVQEAMQTRRYERIEETFRIAQIADWSTAPEAYRPGKVPTNTVYHAMMPGPDGRVLLELTASPGGGMRVRRLSPIAEPVELEPDSFQRVVAKTPYLIMVGGTVYFCASKRASVGRESFRDSLFRPPAETPRKKTR
jgi:hypothetical protein